MASIDKDSELTFIRCPTYDRPCEREIFDMAKITSLPLAGIPTGSLCTTTVLLIMSKFASTAAKAEVATLDGSSIDDDDKELLALGYQPSFKREFSNLATVSSTIFY